MTLEQIHSKLAFDRPSRYVFYNVWELAKIAVTRFHFNPTDIAPAEDGGYALIWIHPIHKERYADIECRDAAAGGTAHANISSVPKEFFEEWQILGYGVPVVGATHRDLSDSLTRIKSFVVDGLIS